MNGALGYATIKDFTNPSVGGCGGSFYSRSFAIGICVDHANSSNIYSYDGNVITNTVFDEINCVGTVTNTTVYTPNTCMSAQSTNPSNTNTMYSSASYNALMPVYDTVAGVDSL